MCTIMSEDELRNFEEYLYDFEIPEEEICDRCGSIFVHVSVFDNGAIHPCVCQDCRMPIGLRTDRHVCRFRCRYCQWIFRDLTTLLHHEYQHETDENQENIDPDA